MKPEEMHVAVEEKRCKLKSEAPDQTIGQALRGLHGPNNLGIHTIKIDVDSNRTIMNTYTLFMPSEHTHTHTTLKSLNKLLCLLLASNIL